MNRALALLLLAAVGCRSAPAAPAGPTSEDLQPLEPGLRWIYRSETGTEVWTVRPGGKVGRFDCRVLEQRSDHAVVKWWVRAEPNGLKVYRRSGGGEFFEPADPIILIRYPGRQGDRWDYEEDYGAVSLRASAEYEADEWVEVPAGSYSAARIRTVKKVQDHTVFDQTSWYARGVGLVRQITNYDDGSRSIRSTIELVNFSTGP